MISNLNFNWLLHDSKINRKQDIDLFYFLERRVKEAAFLRNEEKKSAPVAIETRRDSAEYSDSINSLSSDDIVSSKNVRLNFAIYHGYGTTK